jgi:hypothetical protein
LIKYKIKYMRIVYKMVLMNAPKSVKMAGTLNNTRGGVKKQGLAPTIGLPASVSGVYRNKLGCPCPGAKLFISNTRAPGCSVGCNAGIVYR